MHHCVGGYAGWVKSGMSRIFHLEYRGSSSTLELFGDEIQEHRGPCNSVPSKDHRGLAAALTKFIMRKNARNVDQESPEIPGEDLLQHQYPPVCYL